MGWGVTVFVFNLKYLIIINLVPSLNVLHNPCDVLSFFFFWINSYNGVGGEERRFKLWMSLLKILEGAS